MKQVIVMYKYGRRSYEYPYEHGETIGYDLRFAVIQKVINNGHKAEINSCGDDIVIIINDHNIHTGSSHQ